MEKQKNTPQLRFPEFDGEWERKKLGDIGEIVTGSTPPTANSSYYNGDFLFVSPIDIQGNRYVTNTKTTLTQDGFSKGRKIPEGSSMFVCIGSTIGKVAQAKKECITNQQINSIIPIENNNDFVFSLLEYHSSKIKLLSAVQAVPIINKSTFLNYTLNFPTLPEQKKIAFFFTTIDEKISQLKRKKTLLEQYKKGVMQKIFSQEIRFKDDNGQEFSRWEKKRLKDVVEIKYGKDQKEIACNNGKYPILGTGGEMGRTNEFLSDKPSVLIGRKGTIDKPFYIDTPFWTVDTLFYTNVFSNINPKWLFYELTMINWYKYNEASGVPSLSTSTIYKIPVNVPCLPEQTNIANFLSAIDDKINHTQKQIEKADLWKKGLLQKMFV